MKKGLKIAFLSVVALAALTAFIIVVARAASSYLSGEETKKCQTHTARIENSIVTPAYIEAHICDTLTITNSDNVERLMAFGRHDKHVEYDGISEKILEKDQSLTVTLNALGDYKFHDHDNDDVQGTFTVENH